MTLGAEEPVHSALTRELPNQRKTLGATLEQKNHANQEKIVQPCLLMCHF